MNFRKHFIERAGKPAMVSLEADHEYYSYLLKTGRVYIMHTDDVTVIPPDSDPYRDLTNEEIDQVAFIVQQLETAIESLGAINPEGFEIPESWQERCDQEARTPGTQCWAESYGDNRD